MTDGLTKVHHVRSQDLAAAIEARLDAAAPHCHEDPIAEEVCAACEQALNAPGANGRAARPDDPSRARGAEVIPAHIKDRLVTDANGCWLWRGALNQDGYGVVTYEGRQVKAHRLVYELVTGRRIGGLVLLHACDELHPGIVGRRCCNPAHLTPGTRAENAADRHRKGRSPRQVAKSPGAPEGRRYW